MMNPTANTKWFTTEPPTTPVLARNLKPGMWFLVMRVVAAKKLWMAEQIKRLDYSSEEMRIVFADGEEVAQPRATLRVLSNAALAEPPHHAQHAQAPAPALAPSQKRVMALPANLSQTGEPPLRGQAGEFGGTSKQTGVVLG